jgi:hypothetical protein
LLQKKRYDTTLLLLVTNDINITVTVTWLKDVTNDTINEVSFLHKQLTPFFGVVGTLLILQWHQIDMPVFFNIGKVTK